ncbi:MAG: 4Fe-4S binding protein [Negativicutes bacterium]|nr:4Fe-4S binding protein [Negativicutes bacterium]
MANRWKTISYLVLILYLSIGFFLFPIIGSIALVCMLAPVVMAIWRGREWCGLYCPRGSLWDQVLTKINSSKKIPGWAKTKEIRIFMLVLIFSVFGWQMGYAWPDPVAIGLVFLRIIFITTIVGILLALIYSPRTWCNFCPMGTLAAGFAAGKKPILVNDDCVKCGLCAKACPMELSPYTSGSEFAHPDCLKCGVCIASCPKDALQFTDDSGRFMSQHNSAV